jgi:hypothetical protein
VENPASLRTLTYLDSILVKRFSSCVCKIQELWHIILLFLNRYYFTYFNASKIKDLGVCRIGYHYHTIGQAFIYTPCWNGELFAEN